MSVNSALSVMMVLFLVSCATEEDRVRKAVEEYQALNMNDFSSYEFVSLTLDSTITQSQNINHRLNQRRESLQRYKDHLANAEEDVRLFGASFKQFAQHWEKEIDENQRITSQLDSLLLSLGDKANIVSCTIYSYTYRENNELGAKVLRSGKLYLTPELEVKRIALDSDSELLTCNELPAYLEIVKQK
jgi:hypothetical protein